MEFKIIIDSREQNPLTFPRTQKCVVSKLDVGDYSVEEYEKRIAIERKSLPDLFQTLGRGNKRFKKELERAREYEYFAIIIDGSYRECKYKSFPGSHYSSMRGYVIAQIVLTLHIKYGINVFFAEDRMESAELVRDLFRTYLKLKGKKNPSPP